MRFGVIQFPGSCDDRDALAAARLVGDAELLRSSRRELAGVDAVVIPGGFSYGDYLRAGAIASLAPVMEAVVAWAREGGLVLGICNGFQVLCEAGLLPGALLPNTSLRFSCREVTLEVVNRDTPFTRACDGPDAPGLRIPVKHSWGRYYADEDTVAALEDSRQVVFRYHPAENLNGSVHDIAGVCNEQGNVLGLMPHPEHAVDALRGSVDGLCIFESMRQALDAVGV